MASWMRVRPRSGANRLFTPRRLYRLAYAGLKDVDPYRPATLWVVGLTVREPPRRAVEGTWDADFYKAVAPRGDRLVVTKRGIGGFIGTELDRLLRLRGVTQSSLRDRHQLDGRGDRDGCRRSRLSSDRSRGLLGEHHGGNAPGLPSKKCFPTSPPHARPMTSSPVSRRLDENAQIATPASALESEAGPAYRASLTSDPIVSLPR
jgi:hypothetical protein